MKPEPLAAIGTRYKTPTGDVIVYEVRPVGRGYQVRAVERVVRDLLPGGEFIRRWPHRKFCRLVGIAA